MAYKVLQPKEAFDRLVQLGCPELLLTAIYRELLTASKATTEPNDRRLPQSVSRKVAEVNDALCKVEPRIVSLAKEPGIASMLPEMDLLLTAMVQWQQGADRLRGGHEPAISHARARLIDTVYFFTKGYRDEEVSVLVSDALDRVVDRQAQQRWRQRHGQLIDWARSTRHGEALEALWNFSRQPADQRSSRTDTTPANMALRAKD